MAGKRRKLLERRYWKKISKIVIVSPRQHHGGAIVLHALCKTLVEMGYQARIFYVGAHAYKYKLKNKNHPLYKLSPQLYDIAMEIEYWIFYLCFLLKDELKLMIGSIIPSYAEGRESFNGYSNISIQGCKRKIMPVVGRKTIVVYPDIIYGNPLHASNVVRWLLYHNRYCDVQGAFGDNDLFFCYRDIFNDYSLNPSGRKLNVSYFDLDFYKRTNYGERSGNCYIVRKGRNRKDLPDEFDGPVIDNLPEKEKVRVFNRCEYCISYDTQTAYSSIASMCGCVSVVVPEPGKKREDYKGKGEKGYGVAWGFEQEEVNFALNTRDMVLDDYIRTNNQAKENVKQFISTCENYFV